MTEKAFVGIDPETKQCLLVSDVRSDSLLDACIDGLIIVPVPADKARQLLFEVVPDVYGLTGGEQ